MSFYTLRNITVMIDGVLNTTEYKICPPPETKYFCLINSTLDDYGKRLMYTQEMFEKYNEEHNGTDQMLFLHIEEDGTPICYTRNETC